MSEQTKFRCAIYTRKSSEEGLDQDFNSIEAQREAGEAYVRSQAHEGWTVVPDRFDDGGFSGGNMDRPALTRLMEAVAAGKIDVVVIYKIDRLTRSLTDFARLAETFDKHKVSFVSVTQQFNTTNSMGRLMLNVLLSFAQFEREITGERIRDKIAASKKKGMWMGGPIPMGYLVKDRRLTINDTEAATVRRIFSLYLELGDVPTLLERMAGDGIVTPPRKSTGGRSSGSKPFTRGHIYKLLSNPLYIGRVRHRSTSHPGQHEPIIDMATWTKVQAQLAQNTQGTRQRRRRAVQAEHLLADRLVSAEGHRFIPTHATKGARRYHYYVEDVPTGITPRRLPAREIELVVTQALARYLRDQSQLISDIDVAPSAARAMLASATTAANLLDKPASATGRALIAELVSRVVYRDVQIEIQIPLHILRVRMAWRDTVEPRTGSNTSEDNDLVVVRAPLNIRRRGRQMKLTVAGSESKQEVSGSISSVIARARDWADRVTQGSSPIEIAEQDRVTAAYVSHVLHLAYLAPSVVETILAGLQAVELTAGELIWRTELPLRWSDQASMFAPN
jgi:site-specific DNA recombinase